MNQNHIVAKFDDEHKLAKALGRLKDNKVNIIDVYGPFATHAILKKVTRESRLPYMAVIYGFSALTLTFAFLYWTTVIDYPLNYGGKPYFSFPPMVVIMFLLTILTTTILSTLTFHARTFLFPGKQIKVMDERITDDKFYLVLDQNSNPDEIKQWLTEDGAEEILEKEI